MFTFDLLTGVESKDFERRGKDLLPPTSYLLPDSKAVRSFALLQHVCRDVSDYFNVVRPHMFPHTDAVYCLPLRLSFANGLNLISLALYQLCYWLEAFVKCIGHNV